MNANLSNFLSKLSNDKKLASEFFENQNLKDLYAFATTHSKGGFSEQELQKALDIMEVCAIKINKRELRESDLESISGGQLFGEHAPGAESDLRSIVMVLPSMINLVLTGGELLNRYFTTKKRYESEQDKLRIAELEEKLNELEALKEQQTSKLQ